MMGRWKSGKYSISVEFLGELTQITGAPIDRDPTTDNVVDAKDINKVNDFDYSDDTAQAKCPFTSHLRKVSYLLPCISTVMSSPSPCSNADICLINKTNPRASARPGLNKVQLNRRIIRQGNLIHSPAC